MKRYDCDLRYIGTGSYVPDMTESPDGDWVEYDDLPQWSSDLEACPEGVYVLVYAPRGFYEVARLLTWRGGFETAAGDRSLPTHWMPLPEGPK